MEEIPSSCAYNIHPVGLPIIFYYRNERHSEHIVIWDYVVSIDVQSQRGV